MKLTACEIKSVNLTNADFFMPLNFSAAFGNLGATTSFSENVIPLNNDNICVDIH